MKNSAINIMVCSDVEKKLKEKADELGLTLTSFFEKVANEEIIFLDKNVKKVAALFKISMQ